LIRVAAGDDQQLGGGVGADAVGGEQAGVGGGDHGGDGRGEVADLPVEVLVA
jgi:hypothetical protein